ncbi:host-nuclease inhibitor Gam family protein [Leptospira interrogans]|uniref:Host-nuclease inhibitor Gam family protein n=1 Tax=Leptospira interrogans TaxID=173 RepID=A0AAV9FY06_LEPIR|nr:host-nuclease inhibitor Gam family protein [Leptospira interrogans]KAK2618948.1 host-nuclease inhibitor Gam family protein [Leptospira interrogans]KAK2620487.1 host-nuclease inhibitor Gam family protein [Leptospira interrogans]KAK2620934.1 host-nuclease inhibitor Gam family protein [Leptospira interrogans]
MAKKTPKGKVELSNNLYKNRADLTQAIAQLGEIKRERDRVKSEVDDQISQLTTQLQTDLTPLDVKIQHIVSGIRLYVNEHLDDLFPDPEYRTCKLPTGLLKLRKVPASVKTRGTTKLFEKILSENGLLNKFNAWTLKLSGLFLRVKLEFNKDQILSDPLRASKNGIYLNKEIERLYITPSEIDAEIEAVGDAA